LGNRCIKVAEINLRTKEKDMNENIKSCLQRKLWRLCGFGIDVIRTFVYRWDMKKEKRRRNGVFQGF